MNVNLNFFFQKTSKTIWCLPFKLHFISPVKFLSAVDFCWKLFQTKKKYINKKLKNHIKCNTTRKIFLQLLTTAYVILGVN